MEALAVFETALTSTFATVLSMSAMASLLIVAVIALRAILRHAPKWIACLLWGLVGIRLLFPFSIQSPLSIFTPLSHAFPALSGEGTSTNTLFGLGATTLTENVAGAAGAATSAEAGIAAIDPLGAGASISASSTASSSLAPSPSLGLLSGADALFLVAALTWTIGVLVMAGCAVISYLRIRRCTKERMPYADLHKNEDLDLNTKTNVPIYCADAVKSPFILGIFKPQIYLPSHIDSATANAVIRHEEAHLARHDNFWKPLAYTILALHWFNPLCWVAFILLGRDMESACDEKVIAKLQFTQRKAYALALVNCSAPTHRIAACPVAFGEVGVKGRVKSVLNYKRPAFWIIIVGVLVCIAAAFFFLTNPLSEAQQSSADSAAPSANVTKPVSSGTQDGEWQPVIFDKPDPNLDKAISAAILDYNDGKYQKGSLALEKHILLGPDEEKRVDGKLQAVRIFVIAHYGEYEHNPENGTLTETGGSIVPAALTFDVTADGSYKLTSYQEPRDGADYAKDLEAMFPPEVRKKIEDNWEELCEDLDEQSINLAASNLSETERAAAATAISASFSVDSDWTTSSDTEAESISPENMASHKAYKNILSTYTKRLNTAAARLTDEFKTEAKNLNGDKTRLSSLLKAKIESLSVIYTEGSQRMKETALKYHDTEDVYDYWDGKLDSVYKKAANQIDEAHRKATI